MLLHQLKETVPGWMRRTVCLLFEVLAVGGSCCVSGLVGCSSSALRQSCETLCHERRPTARAPAHSSPLPLNHYFTGCKLHLEAVFKWVPRDGEHCVGTLTAKPSLNMQCAHWGSLQPAENRAVHLLLCELPAVLRGSASALHVC